MAQPVLPNLTDAEAAAIYAGAPHVDTGILQIPFDIGENSSPPLITRVTQLMQHLRDLLAGPNQGKVIAVSNPPNLNVGAFALRYKIAATEYAFAGIASFALTASSTNYLYLDTDAVLENSTTGWPAGDHFKLAICTTNGTAVTSITDERMKNFPIGAQTNWWTLSPTANVPMNGAGFTNVGPIDLANSSELTIATGAITNIGPYHRVDTENNDAADDLDTISNALGSDNANFVILRAENASRIVTVTGTGNIKLHNGAYVMDNLRKCLGLMLVNAEWVEIFRGYHTVSSLSTDLDCNEHVLSEVGKFNLSTYTSKTISNGAITYDRAWTKVYNEIGAATDDLVTINGGAAGDVLFLQARDNAQVPKLKHGSGNIRLAHKLDRELSDVNLGCFLQYDGTNWNEFGPAPRLHEIGDPNKSVRCLIVIPVTQTLAINTTYNRRIFLPDAAIIEQIAASVGTAPSGGTCIVDLLYDGASIFANESEMAIIPNGGFTGLSFVKNTLVGGVKYIQARTGSSVAGAADLTVTAIVRVNRLNY